MAQATTSANAEATRLASRGRPGFDAVAAGCMGQARRAFLLCRRCADPRIPRSWHPPVDLVSRLISKVGWTGHRPDIFLDPETAKRAVYVVASELAASGTERFLVGGQRGVDIWAAEAAIMYAVPVFVLLPCSVHEFTESWSEADRSLLLQILEQAAEVRVLAGYSARNHALAEQPELLVAVWTGIAGGGTAETIAFAQAAGTPIREILLDPSPTATKASGRGI